MNAQELSSLETGCYIDGCSQTIAEGTLSIISLAESFGMPAVELPNEDSETYDEELESIAQDVEDWLNDNASPDNAHWYWHDSDFGLWREDDDETEDLEDCIEPNILTLADFTRSRFWESYRDSIFSNMAINDVERFERCEKCAPGDGSTHYESIEDMRDAVKDARLSGVIADSVETAILAELAVVFDWHKSNGSLDTVIG